MISATLHLRIHCGTLPLHSLLISVIYYKDHIEHVICLVSRGPKKSNSNLIAAFHSMLPQSLKICCAPTPTLHPVFADSELTPHSVWSSRLQPSFQVIFHLSLIDSLQLNWATGQGTVPNPLFTRPYVLPEHPSSPFSPRWNLRSWEAKVTGGQDVSSMSPHHT